MQLDQSLPDVGIVDAAYNLPGEPVDLLEWGPRHAVPEARIRKLILNRCRYFHEANDASDGELAAEAARRLLAVNEINPSDIAFLIHAHTQPFSSPSVPDSILTHVRRELGVSPLLEFSLTQLACTSVLHALTWARELLTKFPQSRYALVTTADRVFGKVEHRLRQDGCIQSDGGAAILIGRSDIKAWFGQPVVHRFNRLHDGPDAPGNDRLIVQSCWRQTRDVLRAVEQEYQRSLDDFAYILPTNADWSYWRLTARGLGLPDSKFYDGNIGRRGHACSNDLAINLVDIGFRELAAGRPVIYFAQSNLGIQAALPFFSETQAAGSHHAR